MEDLCDGDRAIDYQLSDIFYNTRWWSSHGVCTGSYAGVKED